MSRREFQFSDGAANKFWAIEVSGTSQTVHFGRVGTTGQAQTKVFASEDEAKKASDKLIAEKVKKGYAEVAGATKSTGTPTATVKSANAEPAAKKPKGKAKVEPAEEAEPAKPVAPLAPMANAATTRTIDLEPEDILKAEWPKVWRPKVRPEPRPFDLEQCVDALSKVSLTKYGWWNRDWPADCIPESITGQEAHFWLLAMLRYTWQKKLEPPAAAQQLAKEQFKGKLSLEETVELLLASERLDSNIVRSLRVLLDLDEMIELIFTELKDKYGNNPFGQSLIDGAAEFLLPSIDDDEFQKMRLEVERRLTAAHWQGPTDSPPICDLAIHLGMLQPMRISLSQYQPTSGRSGFYRLRFWILSLGDPELIESEARRLKIQWTDVGEIRQWLASTRYGGLDVVRDSILSADTHYDYSSNNHTHYTAKEQAERLTVEFARVKAPEAAPYMLELKLSSKAPGVARQWLDEQVGNAVAGLIPTAAGRGKLAEAAVEYLREAKKKGHEKLIRDCLKNAAPDVAESIQKNVLDFAEKEYAVLDAKSLPAELKTALEAKGKKGKIPAWASVTALPPLLIADKKLGADHATAVLEALQRSALGKPDPLVAALKKVGDPTSLDAFAWKLFQHWQSEGCPPKEKWAMASVGLFGGDSSALKLTPLVRNWPGESQHQRAVFGLECLRAIGSDTALMQLNGIAQKLKFKGLKQKATEAMEAIATDKGLTRSQLEDRIVPDCDLDERGSRVFDFGPRQFRFVLGPDMKPMIKDADGKVKTDLPKPGAKDDTTKAEAAVGDWKLMKKQIKEVVAIQGQRLEQAMVTGRRWPVADFETLLVKHPLMTNLVRLILWGGYDKGKLKGTFRVTEDQTFADMKDGDFKLAGFDEIGIVHPLRLSAAEQSTWGEVFSDYELVPPFRQLGRRVVRPEPSELTAKEILRFKGIAVPAPTMVYGLEKLGWVRGLGMDGGCFDEHSKVFLASNLTAVVHYEGNVGFGFIDPNETLKFENCYFVEGIRKPSGFEQDKKTVPLKDVDPVVISEVLTDLSALAAKGK